MKLLSIAGLQPVDVKQLLGYCLVATLLAWITRSFYRLYLHPLSKFPGPKIAAVSDAWYAYQSLLGRWPWAVEDALKKYGDVVRIAPNELVFIRPEAMHDIYGSHDKYLERFPKTQIGNHGNDKHGGLLFEWDPVRHREVSKKISPAFSGRALKAKEPTLHKYVDLFVQRRKEYGTAKDGVVLHQWVNWACVDISAEMAYNRKMNALTDRKNPPYLELLAGFNKFIVIIQMSWRFPLIGWLKWPLLLFSMRPHSDIREHSRQQLEDRIRRKGTVEHLDFFEQLVPEDRELPKYKVEMRHLEQCAAQLLIAGYEAPAMWMYNAFYMCLRNPEAAKILAKEIREEFDTYNEITAARAGTLPYLTAFLQETLRIMPNALTGMPVISPGTMVDGNYIPKGTVCQSSSFAQGRSPEHFLEPHAFKPQRWLPESHPLFEEKHAEDNREGYFPFSLGPRVCVGKQIAWWQGRVFMAKVMWTFDLEMIPGQDIDMDRDLRGWGMYVKPEICLRFVPVEREI